MFCGVQWCSLQECLSCGLLGSSAVIERGLLLAHLCVGLTSRLPDSEAQPRPWHVAAMQVVTTRSGICLSRFWCLPKSPFGYATCEAFLIFLRCSLKLATGCVVSGPLGRDSGLDQCQMLPVTGPGRPVWSSLNVSSSVIAGYEISLQLVFSQSFRSWQWMTAAHLLLCRLGFYLDLLE